MVAASIGVAAATGPDGYSAAPAPACSLAPENEPEAAVADAAPAVAVASEAVVAPALSAWSVLSLPAMWLRFLLRQTSKNPR